MAQDSRNQLQTQRKRVRAMEWRKLFRALGVPEDSHQREAVFTQMRAIEELSFTVWINEGW